MQTVEPLSADVAPYGVGVQQRERGGRAVFGHTGSTMGFNGEVFIDASTGLCVAVQTNDFFGTREAVALPLWEALAATGH